MEKRNFGKTYREQAWNWAHKFILCSLITIVKAQEEG